MRIKMTKEEKQQKTIAEGIGALADAVECLDTYSKTLDDAIDAAAINKEDEYSDSLIEQKVSVVLLKSDFEFMLLQLKDQVSAAQAFNSLKDLPDVLNACKQIASKVPDLSKLTASMASFREMTQQYAKDVKNLREKLSQSRSKKSVWATIGLPKADDKHQQGLIEAEKQARASRLALKVSGNIAPKESSNNVVVDEIDSIMRGIEEEKGKK